ncbi:MAG: hypothetical protein ACR2ND_00740 [Solirubrobacteraceae bacterium]
MSDPLGPEEDHEGEAEIVDALPVLVGVQELEPTARSQGAAIAQTAAVAATGFAFGVAASAVLGRRLQRQAGRIARSRAASAALESPSTRTFLVTVHMLGRRGD